MIGKYRWTICSLVFFATTINYLDRAVISLLKSDLSVQFHWTETDYSNIVICFQVAYAAGMLGMGYVIDRIGTRIGYGIVIIAWSLAAMAHALARSTMGFGIARAALGVSEAGNFPAAIKTISEWFPKKERAFAAGIFNSGTNIGAILAPLTVPLIAKNFGWQWAFILTGAIGFVWLIAWFIFYEIPARQRRLKKPEYDYIHSDLDEQVVTERISWLRLMNYRQTWAIVVGKFLTDPVWWFYLFWLPAFLKAQYHLEGTDVALPIALVYTMAAIGSIAGGYLPLALINKKWPVIRARRSSMLLYAICVIPVVFAQWLGAFNMWVAIVIIGLAASAHQAWSANMYTIVSDTFPKKAVASVTGIAGMAGAVGGILIARLAGLVFDHYKALGRLETGYYILFIICGSAYVTAWLFMQALAPKMKRVSFDSVTELRS